MEMKSCRIAHEEQCVMVGKRVETDGPFFVDAMQRFAHAGHR